MVGSMALTRAQIVEFEQSKTTERDLAHVALRDANDAYLAAVAAVPASVDDIAARAGRVGVARRAQLEAEQRLADIQEELFGVRELAFAGRSNARQARVASLEREQAQIEQQEAELQLEQAAKHREYLAAVAALDDRIAALQAHRNRLGTHVAQLRPNSARRLEVFPATADPLEPPADVLVRPSQWRLVIEQARQQGEAHIVVIVNEHDGVARQR